VHRTQAGLVCASTGPGLEHRLHLEQTEQSWALSCRWPGYAVFYRIDDGVLECSDELARLTRGDVRATMADATLLSLIHGVPFPPDATHVPGVRRLVVGGTLRVDERGIVVTMAPPDPPAQLTPQRPTRLTDAITEWLAALGDNWALAFSGGLASTFLAVCASNARACPPLLHVPLASPLYQPELPGVHGRTAIVIGQDLVDHMAEHHISGTEALPPLPDVCFPSRVLRRAGLEQDRVVVTGVGLESLVTTDLPHADLGLRSRRLRSCEPFHPAGRLRTIRHAQRALRQSPSLGLRTSAAEHDPVPDGGSQSPGPIPHELPGLTDRGRATLEYASLAARTMIAEHVVRIGPLYTRLEQTIRQLWLGDEVSVAATRYPALAPGVLAATAALTPSELGKIHSGLFVNHLPLRAELSRHGINRVRESPGSFWARLAAARYLLRERRTIATDLSRNSALAERGLIDPAALSAALADGAVLAEHALPILRAVWLDRWLCA
jgi:hypothetical protein